jgi:hypothetical protein
MQLTVPRPHSFSHLFGLAPAAAAPVSSHPQAHAQERARRSGGPEDRALYSCGCGYAFKASVTTTVGCPHCGQQQAW